MRECVTARHLLESTLASCVSTIGDEVTQDCDESLTSRCENPNSLAVHLQKLLKNKGSFILVFDGMDNQRENLPSVLPALARLGYSVLFLQKHVTYDWLIIYRFLT